ncbi:MAG: DUF4446 family protein [Candidatus Taylorbacteria bacterium]|nr:DUF4446 family protein [Candidatus Taylorbacteria bacterium]
MTTFTDPTTLLIILAVLGFITIILLILVISMHLKLKKFLVDVNAHNIADSLNSVSDDLKDLQKSRDEMESYLTESEKRLRRSVQSVSTVRFNPFQGDGSGGNQSFATAFLNEEGNGVVISSLYSRDRVSIFSKPIKNNTSEHEMSDEEKEALEKAKKEISSLE